MRTDYSLVNEHGFIEKIITSIQKGDNFYHGNDRTLYRAKEKAQMTPTGDGYFVAAEDEDFNEKIFVTEKSGLAYYPKFFVVPNFTQPE